jgi:NH3-dependent NAD+ synthetase
MPFARASFSSSLPDPKLAGTVIVGMSGGVDSAVAALLLQRAGFAVQGLFMSNWEDDDDAYCTSAGDFQDARRVCDALQLPLHKVSFAAAVSRTGVRAVPARIRRGANAKPGRALQPRNQIRRLFGLHAPSRRLVDRHRPLRARLEHTSDGARGC